MCELRLRLSFVLCTEHDVCALQMMYDAETVVSGRGTADSDSDEEPNTLQDDHDDDSSDDDDDDDVCEQKMVKTRELEWDDSTLSY